MIENVPPRDPPAAGGDSLPDGLGRLRAWLAAGAQPPMAQTLGIALTEVDAGRAVFEGTPTETVYNPLGVVHGGYAAALLDSACGCAVHSRLAPDQSYTTLELNVAFHKPITSRTGRVRAVGHAVTVGRRVAFAEAKLTDERGAVLASATSTLLVMSP
jgi:uncharacterized protein (TIGR00369 family)